MKHMRYKFKSRANRQQSPVSACRMVGMKPGPWFLRRWEAESGGSFRPVRVHIKRETQKAMREQ